MSSGRLELRGVRAGYGATTVLRDVDLVAPSGRVTALLGPNGAGKSTLLRVAAGLLPPSAGSVHLSGADVTAVGPAHRHRRELSFVPEGRAVFPNLTVRENLALFSRDGRPEVDEVLTAFPRLGERLHQAAGTMSGGEQQMLALARTYLSQPRCVLLDEVSMGLAPRLVDEIFGFIQRLAQSGVALLIVEQYVHHVLEIADLVYVLRKGRIAFAGQRSEVDADRIALDYLGTSP